MANCPYCGAPLQSQDILCGRCGRPVVTLPIPVNEAASSSSTPDKRDSPNSRASSSSRQRDNTAGSLLVAVAKAMIARSENGPHQNENAGQAPAQPTMPAVLNASQPTSAQATAQLSANASGSHTPAAYCPHCGSALDSDDEFCGKCGKPIGQALKQFSRSARQQPIRRPAEDEVEPLPNVRFNKTVKGQAELLPDVRFTEIIEEEGEEERPEVKLVALVCPNCGGELQMPKGEDSCTCPYCGTQFVLDRGKRTVIHRYVDEATLQRLEFEKQLAAEERLGRTVRFFLWLIPAIVGVILMIVGPSFGLHYEGLFVLEIEAIVALFVFLSKHSNSSE